MSKPSKRRVDASSAPSEDTGALGFEIKLWDAADLLRNSMDPAQYKHVVLGLLFLKYITDAYEERGDAGERVFRVPELARWSHLRAHADTPEVGVVIDAAMDAIEHENPTLAGVLPRVYALENLDPHSLAKLVALIDGIELGTQEQRDKDTLGRVYEYFLSKFASQEGRGGGEFYTPTSVVRLLTQMLEPHAGRVYDPCCGSGGMFVQSLKFGGQREQVSIYGQESNRTTWRLARINMAIRGIEADLGSKAADSLHEDLHADLRADFILANPPFNISQWGGERLEQDPRWAFGTPPANNANFAWVQHFIHHLAPTGAAGFVLANGSMSATQSGEGEIRQRIVEADLVDCVVACPQQLFYATPIPVCLWFLSKHKHTNGHRDRRGELLFIDARALGRMQTRVHRVLDADDIAKVADTYHAWRNEGGHYKDVAGFCKRATLAQIRDQNFELTPGRYVGAALVEDDGEHFADKLARLKSTLAQHAAHGLELDAKIQAALETIDDAR